jgi:hypothetical protein
LHCLCCTRFADGMEKLRIHSAFVCCVIFDVSVL